MGRRQTGAPTRREFLRWTAGGAVAATSFQALTSGRLLHAASSGSGDYKALVVMYLAGGNDSFNMVVPTNASAYNDYQASRQNLAVPSGDLLPITPATPDGNTYGLHPSLPLCRGLFEDGKLAITANVGNLVMPVTRAQYQSGVHPLPPRLFSHNDQQAQSMRVAADRAAAIGWGGALADQLASRNGGSLLSPSITLAGSTPLLAGTSTQAYHLGTDGAVALSGFWGSTGANLQSTFDVLRQQSQVSILQQQFAATRGEAIDIGATITTALDGAAPLVTPFPEDSVSSQLEMVARMVAVHGALGMERQVFFVKMGGFDTHAGQNGDQPNLFATVDGAIAAFQAAMEELGCPNNVTLAVVSEFGRTLSSNGQGTDHGWGGHFLTVGGAVRGGDIYGTMPSFVIDGADDAGSGRMIPTTATDQFSATLARWLGVDPLELPTIYPNLASFPTDDLGFMV